VYKIFDKHKLLIVFWTVFIVLINIVLGGRVYLRGEFPSYMMTMTAIENHFSEWITLNDIDDAKKLFPEYREHLEPKNLEKLVERTEENLYRGYYPGVYSFCVIFMKNILLYTDISLSYAFPLVNLILLLVSSAFFAKKVCKENTIVSFLLCVFNPILFYVRWVSAEVFIYSMLLISIVFFLDKHYKLAFLFSILAALMNIVIIFWSGMIVLTYLINNLQYMKGDKFLGKIALLIKKRWIDLMYFIFFGIVCIVWFLGLSVHKVGTSNIFFEGWLERALYYVIDMNIGLVWYYGPLFILFLYCFYKGIKNKNLENSFIAISFISILLLYSLKEQICSDCNAIARYNAWNGVFIIAMLLVYKTKTRKFDFYLIVSLIFVMSITFVYKGINCDVPYDKFNSISRYTLNNVPHLYIGHKHIFATNIYEDQYEAIDSSLFIYSNDDGYVTKILIHPNDIINLNKYISIDNVRLNDLKNKYGVIKQDNVNNDEKIEDAYDTRKEYVFLTFSPSEKVIKNK